MSTILALNASVHCARRGMRSPIGLLKIGEASNGKSTEHRGRSSGVKGIALLARPSSERRGCRAMQQTSNLEVGAV
jgi:hypothetical protein